MTAQYHFHEENGNFSDYSEIIQKLAVFCSFHLIFVKENGSMEFEAFFP